MTKSDLTTGMRVQLRNGNIYIVCLFGNDSTIEDEFGYYIKLSDYRDDLTVSDNNIKYDIMKIYNMNNGMLDKLNHDAYGSLIWERTDERLIITVDGIEYSEGTLKSIIRKFAK